MLGDVTTITVNFKTPDLLRDAVTTFVAHYPSVSYIVIDNGGCAKSAAAIRSLVGAHPHIVPVYNHRNRGHGPALHQGMLLVTTPYAFTLDSDTKVVKGGFLEDMLARFKKDEGLFAIGWVRYVNSAGVAGPHQELKRGMPYVHPYASMMDVAKYKTLPSFIHSGAPATHLMNAAKKRGYNLESYPIQQYVWHKIAGTRGMFGGRCRVDTAERPMPWRKHRI